MLDGVLITPKRVIADDLGEVRHMMRNDEDAFEQFGEVYLSWVKPDVTKGWKLHTRVTGNVCVPVGQVRYVLHDMRSESPTHGQTQEVSLGTDPHQLLTIPPGIAYAWQNLSKESSLVLNCTAHPWEAGEAQEIPLQDIAFDW